MFCCTIVCSICTFRLQIWSNRGIQVKARVCNVVQKHILLYWVKWSCYPESSQYIMYSEKGTKIIRPLWQLQDWEKADQSVLFSPNSSDWSDAFMSRPLSLPPPRVHMLGFTDAGNIRHTLPQKYGVAGEDGHLVTMAEKMQPVELVTDHP